MIIEVELVGFISLLAFHFSFSRANCLSIDDSDVVLFSLLPLKCCILLCLCCNMSLFPNSLSLFFFTLFLFGWRVGAAFYPSLFTLSNYLCHVLYFLSLHHALDADTFVFIITIFNHCFNIQCSTLVIT